MTNNVPTVLDRSIPDFLEREYGTLFAFIRKYYEWLSSQKNTLDVSNSLIEYRDIDSTLDEFIEFFEKEYAVNIPSRIKADKKNLIKNLKNFYLNKGNEDSYKFIFNIVFGEDVSFYYPKVDILRASSGKWYIQKTLKTRISEPQIEILKKISSRKIIGMTSGATALVESVVSYVERQVIVAEITLSDVNGTFLANENVSIQYYDEAENSYEFVASVLPVYDTVNIVDGGSGYKIDDIFYIKDSSRGNLIVGLGRVKNVSRGPVLGLSISSGGVNYNGNTKEVTHFSKLPINYNLSGNVIADQPISTYSSYTINQLISTQYIAGTGDLIIFDDNTNSSGYGAYGVVSRVDDEGTILEAQLISRGDLYESPDATVQSATGSEAEFNVVGGGGNIKNAKIDIFPMKLSTDTTNIYLDFSNSGDANAIGTLGSGVQISYPGRYLSDDGHLSSTKKVQDGRYYQEYSYVLKTNLSISVWKDTVRKILHPAGFEMFGEVVSIKEISAKPKATKDLKHSSVINRISTINSSLYPKLVEFNKTLLQFTNYVDIISEDGFTFTTEDGLDNISMDLDTSVSIVDSLLSEDGFTFTTEDGDTIALETTLAIGVILTELGDTLISEDEFEFTDESSDIVYEYTAEDGSTITLENGDILVLE